MCGIGTTNYKLVDQLNEHNKQNNTYRPLNN